MQNKAGCGLNRSLWERRKGFIGERWRERDAAGPRPPLEGGDETAVTPAPALAPISRPCRAKSID